MKTNTRENDYIRRINPPCSERKGGAVSTSRRNNTTESSPTYEFYSASASQEMLNERYFSTSETSRFTAGNEALTPPPPFFLSSSPLHTSASRRTRFVPQTTAARRGAAPRQTHFEDGRSRVEMTAGFVRPRTMRVVLCAVIVLRRPTLLWH